MIIILCQLRMCYQQTLFWLNLNLIFGSLFTFSFPFICDSFEIFFAFYSSSQDSQSSTRKKITSVPVKMTANTNEKNQSHNSKKSQSSKKMSQNMTMSRNHEINEEKIRLVQNWKIFLETYQIFLRNTWGFRKYCH